MLERVIPAQFWLWSERGPLTISAVKVYLIQKWYRMVTQNNVLQTGSQDQNVGYRQHDHSVPVVWTWCIRCLGHDSGTPGLVPGPA